VSRPPEVRVTVEQPTDGPPDRVGPPLRPDASPQTFQLYQLAVEMADRISARRGVANSFFAALQSGVLGVLGFLTTAGADPDRWVLVAVCVAGVATSVTWFLLLRSYRTLNRAKFVVIGDLETRLPYAVFANEWQSLKRDPIRTWRTRYAELGTVERLVPVVFLLMYAALGVYLAVR
jgi:hypothetical protein